MGSKDEPLAMDELNEQEIFTRKLESAKKNTANK